MEECVRMLCMGKSWIVRLQKQVLAEEVLTFPGTQRGMDQGLPSLDYQRLARHKLKIHPNTQALHIFNRALEGLNKSISI